MVTRALLLCTQGVPSERGRNLTGGLAGLLTIHRALYLSNGQSELHEDLQTADRSHLRETEFHFMASPRRFAASMFPRVPPPPPSPHAWARPLMCVRT